MTEYLKRKIDDYLVNWKTDPERKPLIIKGARQVGKTKSILKFAETHYESIIEINFVSKPVYKQIVENGYTPEAIKRILEYAQSKYDVHVIAGTFAIGNEGSRRVMEKLGMSFYEDTEYTKLDGSETFKAKTYHRVFD